MRRQFHEQIWNHYEIAFFTSMRQFEGIERAIKAADREVAKLTAALEEVGPRLRLVPANLAPIWPQFGPERYNFLFHWWAVLGSNQ